MACNSNAWAYLQYIGGSCKMLPKIAKGMCNKLQWKLS